MAEAWVINLANCIRFAQVSDIVYERFPVLITLLAGKNSAEAEALTAYLAAEGIDYSNAQYLALDLCKLALFGQHVPSHQVLGFPSSDIQKSELSTRYRLLVGLFHPDKHPQDSEWVTACTERLNIANDSLRKQFALGYSAIPASAQTAKPPVPGRTQAYTYERGTPIFNRRKFGSSAHFSRRFFSFGGLIAVGVLVVVFISSIENSNETRSLDHAPKVPVLDIGISNDFEAENVTTYGQDKAVTKAADTATGIITLQKSLQDQDPDPEPEPLPEADFAAAESKTYLATEVVGPKIDKEVNITIPAVKAGYLLADVKNPDVDTFTVTQTPIRADETDTVEILKIADQVTPTKVQPRASKAKISDPLVFNRNSAIRLIGDYYRALQTPQFEQIESKLADTIRVGTSSLSRNDFLRMLSRKWGDGGNIIQDVYVDPLVTQSGDVAIFEVKIHKNHIDPFTRKTVSELTASISIKQVSSTKYEIIAIQESEKSHFVVDEVELVNRFIVSYMSAYQAGDIDRFMNLFDRSIRHNKKNGKAEVESLYSEFFDITKSRKLQLKIKQRKRLSNEKVQLRIAYSLTAEKGILKQIKAVGDIQMVLLQTLNGLRITEMIL